jgi:hypothetical protein
MLPRRQAGMLQLSEFHECLIEWSRKDIFIISGIKHALPHTFGCTSTTRCNYPIIKNIYIRYLYGKWICSLKMLKTEQLRTARGSNIDR